MAGLYEQIKVAKTDAQITGLLNRGHDYLMASRGTQAKWKRAAAKRLDTLSKQKPAPKKTP